MKQTELRMIAQAVAQDPRIRAHGSPVTAIVPTVVEDVICKLYAGQTLRLYVRKRPGEGERGERDRRVAAADAVGTPTALIARQEGITIRQVQRILARAKGCAA